MPRSRAHVFDRRAKCRNEPRPLVALATPLWLAELGRACFAGTMRLLRSVHRHRTAPTRLGCCARAAGFAAGGVVGRGLGSDRSLDRGEHRLPGRRISFACHKPLERRAERVRDLDEGSSRGLFDVAPNDHADVALREPCQLTHLVAVQSRQLVNQGNTPSQGIQRRFRHDDKILSQRAL